MVSQTRSTNPLTAIAAIVLFASTLLAQPATFPTTTLAKALTGWPAADQPATVIFLASNATIVPGQLPVSTSGIGDPTGHTNQILMVDTEALCVDGPIQPNGGIPVERGCQGTYTLWHNVGATVWVGFPSYYPITVPYGACNAFTQPVLPQIYLNTGVLYDCLPRTAAGKWTPIGFAGTPGGARTDQPWYRRVWHSMRGGG